jgi:hypothetical protein
MEERQDNRIGGLRVVKLLKDFQGPRKSVDFWGGGEMSEATSRPPYRWSESGETHLDDVVDRVGIEPTTSGLKGHCSTPELPIR